MPRTPEFAGIHASPLGGSWYPDHQSKLQTLLTERFDASARRTGSHLLPGMIAAVVPHAAPMYSGTVAAAAYRHLRRASPSRIFILGFCHRAGVPGIGIPDVEGYETPLGDLAVDVAAAHSLGQAEPFHVIEEAALCDHSIEIQLPYLQTVAPESGIVPLYVGELTEQERMAAASTIANAWRPGDVILASSDLTHYGREFHYVPFPVDLNIGARLRSLDRCVIQAAGSIDCALFLETLRDTGATACGARPIALLLRILPLLGVAEIFEQELDYQTSAEITGDFRTSVSYSALGFFPRSSFEVGHAEQRALLRNVRSNLQHLQAGGRREAIRGEALPELTRRAGVFVTLHYQGRVIGCVGSVGGDLPLFEAVPELTLAAALDDPRRLPDGGLPEEIEIEISLLTPMKRVRSADSIRVGLDGGYLEAGGRNALLLPQAARPGWTPAELVQALYRKAGFDPAHRPIGKERLSVFRAQVFGQQGGEVRL